MAVLSKRVVTIPSSMHYFHPCTLCIILVLLLIPPDVETDSPVLTPASVLTATRSQCVVAISNIQNGVDLQSLLTIADVAFREEPKVLVGVADLHDFVWPSGKRLQIEGDESKAKAAVFLVEPEDRTCLLKPTYYKVYPESVGYFGPSFDDVFVEFINSHCNTFRRPDGFLNQKGLHRQYLMENLFSVKECPDSIPISEIFRKQSNKHQQEFCMREVGQSSAVCADPSKKTSSTVFADVPKCERIPLPSKEDFFNNFLARSKPVIITGAMDSWPALSKWTNEFFMKQYGTKEVHIKLTPKGEYEGVESASIWESFGTFRIPADVLKQLPYPDLVVVRPAVIDMNVSEFLTLIQNISEGVFTNVSAYLEYTSVADYFPELKEDLTEMPFFLNVLKLAHLNIWLSDGNTLGKTHFDPFDNFLCQVIFFFFLFFCCCCLVWCSLVLASSFE